jgi:hypothetical protein
MDSQRVSVMNTFATVMNTLSMKPWTSALHRNKQHVEHDAVTQHWLAAHLYRCPLVSCPSEPATQRA